MKGDQTKKENFELCYSLLQLFGAQGWLPDPYG